MIIGRLIEREEMESVLENSFLAKCFLTSATTCWVRLSLPSNIVSTMPSKSSDGL